MDELQKKYEYQARELVALRKRVAELEAANTTDRKRMEEKLAYHAQLLAGVHEAITAADENQIITYWNSMAEKMFGWTAEEAIGKHIGNLLQTKVPGSSREAVIERMRKEKYYEGEAIYSHKDGSVVYTAVHSAFTIGGDCTLGGFISTLRDITGQKQAEEALKQARDYLEEKVAGRTKELSLERQRLFDVLETLPVNICLLTTEFDIVFANRAFRERFGEPDGRRCYDYVCGLKEPCEQCQALTPLATGQPHHWMFSGSDGRIIDVHDFPFQDIDGTAMILELNMDITEQRKIETEMARLDRLNLIGEMAASIGHEIRNPMTAVRGFLQMLGDRQGYQYDREFFDIMIEELDRANQIITQYLGMAKNKTINLQLQSLDKIIKALYPMIQSECNLREMGIKLDLCNPTEVWLDDNELRQLTLNMCRNAMEAMSTHGILTIGTKQEGDEVILYIKDEGSGLPSEITDRIGTPFLTTKENGTGLGLAVCYSIAARHNAGIDYDTGPSGTTFYVRFPKP